MKLTKNAINTLLFCVFPGRLIIIWMPLLGYSFVASFVALIEYLCLLLLLVQSFSFKMKPNKYLGVFFLLYIIYSLYLIYYTVINPQIPRGDMLAVPIDDFGVFKDIIIIGLSCYFASKYWESVDFVLLSKISTIVLYSLLIIYAITQPITTYTFIRSLNDDVLADYGLISALVLGRYVAMAFFFALWAKDYWFRNKILNNIIIVFAFLLSLLFLLILTQRGPMLFFLVTILIYFFARYRISAKIIVPILLFILVFYIFFNDILLVINRISPEIVDRFLSIQDDGGSGRFGDDSSVYSLAIHQIKDGTFFGSYFRLLSGSGFYGSYPHNFILELLMTFGFVFTIPFLWILFIAVRKSYMVIGMKSSIGIFSIFLIYIFLTLLTSHSIAFDPQVWCSLVIILSINNNFIINGKKRI